MSFVSRSGSNSWRGKAFEFFRNDKLDTIDYFSKALGRPKPALEQHDFGGVLGGPVKIPGLQRPGQVVLLRILRGLSQQDRAAPSVVTFPRPRCTTVISRTGERERQSHPGLRPGDDARQSECATRSRQPVPLARFSLSRGTSWRWPRCGPTSRVC